MRISILDDDAGHANYQAVDKSKVRIDVYLDGIKQLNVLTADEEEGYLKRHKLNNKGQVYPDTNGEAHTVEENGKVDIVLTDIETT